MSDEFKLFFIGIVLGLWLGLGGGCLRDEAYFCKMIQKKLNNIDEDRNTFQRHKASYQHVYIKECLVEL